MRAAVFLGGELWTGEDAGFERDFSPDNSLQKRDLGF
jgi:hypothetical protein